MRESFYSSVLEKMEENEIWIQWEAACTLSIANLSIITAGRAEYKFSDAGG